MIAWYRDHEGLVIQRQNIQALLIERQGHDRGIELAGAQQFDQLDREIFL